MKIAIMQYTIHDLYNSTTKTFFDKVHTVDNKEESFKDIDKAVVEKFGLSVEKLSIVNVLPIYVPFYGITVDEVIFE